LENETAGALLFSAPEAGALQTAVLHCTRGRVQEDEDGALGGHVKPWKSSVVRHVNLRFLICQMRVKKNNTGKDGESNGT
jgi:hypothetical protein